MNVKHLIKYLLIFIFSFAFITNVQAKDINIETVTLDYNAGGVVINEDPFIDNLSIKFNLKFRNKGDFVKYKIVINNASNEDYEISEKDNLNTSKYIKYIYSYDEQNKIAEAKKKTVMYITIIYENEVPNDKLINGYYNETNNLILDLGESIKNPNTGRMIIISIILIVFVLLFLLMSFKTKRNKRSAFLLILAFLLIPTSIYAYSKMQIKVESKIEIDKPICGSFSTDSWDMISRNVNANNTDCYNVGDAKEIELEGFGTHILRLANKSTPLECNKSDFSQTACGFVVEFADTVGPNMYMNSNGNNVGGWPASDMRNYINTVIFDSLPLELKNVIINTKVVSSHNGNENNFISNDKLYLLSASELCVPDDKYDTAKYMTRKLDIYNDIIDCFNVSPRKEPGYWWLRTVTKDSTTFMHVKYGYHVSWTGNGASVTTGVSPAFRIDIVDSVKR